ncbi:unnamed protein product, partial [Staurois parvus]
TLCPSSQRITDHEKSRRCQLGHVISCVQSQLITWDMYTDHQGTDDQCALMISVAPEVPPVSVHQCQQSVLISATCQFLSVPHHATYQCPSELPFNVTHQCQSVPPINAKSSATYQCCQSVRPISASQCLLSVRISAAYQCQSVPPISASQCRLTVPVSVAYQCQSVLPISASQCRLSMPVSAAYQC